MIGIFIIFEEEKQQEKFLFSKLLQRTYTNLCISDNNRESRIPILNMQILRLKKTVICPRFFKKSI